VERVAVERVVAERVAEEVVVDLVEDLAVADQADQVDLVAQDQDQDRYQDGVQMGLTAVAFVCPAMKWILGHI
jgi:hypothetical protein